MSLLKYGAFIGIALIVAAAVFLVVFNIASTEPTTFETADSTEEDNIANVNNNNNAPMDKTTNVQAIISTNYGDISIELFTDLMPITTDNFITLAEEGFYDGTKFHRVIAGFMLQGGDPLTKGDDTSVYGTGGPGYTIEDEFVSDEKLSNYAGTIAMANTGTPNSGGSQFFINVNDNTNLDFDKPPFSSKHPVFGKVIEGMEVVKEIEQVETTARDMPVSPVVIESIKIVKQ